jgi:hypothetical protein
MGEPNGVRRASEGMSREVEKKKEKGITKYWKEALAGVLALGLALGVTGERSEDPIPLAKLSAELGPDDKVEHDKRLKQAEGGARLLAERLFELQEKQKEIEEVREDIFQELLDGLEEVQGRMDGEEDLYETLSVTKQDNGHIVVEIDGQPLIDVVVSTHGEYKQFLEDQISAMDAISDPDEKQQVQIREIDDMIALSRGLDEDRGFADLSDDTPFYYMDYSNNEDVTHDYIANGLTSDRHDRESILDVVLADVRMYVYHQNKT